MATVILLDVSLSMCRTFKNETTNQSNGVEVRQLANIGIGTLLDYFAQNAQLEHTALVVYSSLWEIKHEFTRHHEAIKNGIYDLELYDKSNIINALRGVLTLRLHEWSKEGPVNIILITDGLLYNDSMCNGKDEENSDLDDTDEDTEEEDEQLDSDGKGEDSGQFFDLPLEEIQGSFNFPCAIQVVCLASPKNPALKYSLPFYKSIVSTVDSTTPDCPVFIGTDLKGYKQSAIWLPKSSDLQVSIEAVEVLFSKMSEVHYKPFHTTLTCGHLSSRVMLSPRPSECNLAPLKNEYDDLKSELMLKDKAKETFVRAVNKVRNYHFSDEISICGFMPIKDIASPAMTSRHLILPVVDKNFNEITKAEHVLSQDFRAYSKLVHSGDTDRPDNNELSGKLRLEKINRATSGDQQPSAPAPSTSGSSRATKHSGPSSVDHSIEHDITKQPSFSVLLHNSLKQENMVAICTVGFSEENKDEWYGILHSYSHQKRSCLMLSLLTPGQSPILWLPNFKNLGSSLLISDLPQSIREKIASNRGTLKSYSSNNVIWLDPESVQADVQKIVRHAKRSPDKAPHFYKELNRIRRAAISYGFYDVLFGLAAILERERKIMSSDTSKTVSQEMLDHIDNVIMCLKADLDESCYETNVAPRVVKQETSVTSSAIKQEPH